MSTSPAWSTRNRIGLGLAIVYGLVNVPSILFAAEEGEVGPPLSIMVLCSILGVAAVVGGIVAWRASSRTAARVTAASIVVMTLTALPAFFVDVPAAVRAATAVAVLLTVVAVVLIFSTSERRAPVLD